jgi:hypothetical protein
MNRDELDIFSPGCAAYPYPSYLLYFYYAVIKQRNFMKVFLIAALAIGFMGTAHADSTTADKAEVTKDNVVRSAKKGVHRTEEAVCTKGDATCLAEKAKHRTQEGGAYVKDKVTEGANKGQ